MCDHEMLCNNKRSALFAYQALAFYTGHVSMKSTLSNVWTYFWLQISANCMIIVQLLGEKICYPFDILNKTWFCLQVKSLQEFFSRNAFCMKAIKM